MISTTSWIISARSATEGPSTTCVGENCQQGQASFFLTGLVHFDADVQPVPIPAAAWLFGSGIAALVRRRKSY